MSLRQFIEMGKQDKPWVFAPMAHSAIAQSGYDPELWFLLAENLASLGLKTIAAAQLDALCQRRSSAATTPMVTDLRERIDQLPDDRIEQTELIANAERSAQTLLARGFDLSQDLETWKINQAGVESFHAADGNIVRLAGEQLLHFGDQLGAARDIGEQNIAKVAQSHAPFTIEGVDPPWLLIELDKQTPIGDSGYQPGIRIIQSDVQEFFDGCAMADISQILSHERVELFIGTAAAEQLKASLARDAGTPISGPYMPLRSLRTPITALDHGFDAFCDRPAGCRAQRAPERRSTNATPSGMNRGGASAYSTRLRVRPSLCACLSQRADSRRYCIRCVSISPRACAAGAARSSC